MSQTFEYLCQMLDQSTPVAMATLVAASGSSPQNVGARLLVQSDGRLTGTIGGGCMEAEARKVAIESLRKRKTRLFGLKLDDDFGWDDGLICGGSVEIFINPMLEHSADALRGALETARQRRRAVLVTALTGNYAGSIVLSSESGAPTGPAFGCSDGSLAAATAETLEAGKPLRRTLSDGTDVFLEPILPRPSLLIAGAGHIGAAVSQIGSLCGFEVVIVDDRPSFANRDRLPWADRIVVADIPAFVRDFPIDRDSYVVIVTRGHRHDARVLSACIHSPARYLGMIGSRRKIVVIFEEMIREGLATTQELLSVRSPMGLTIGDREVGEIAVSIMAEIVAIRNGADLDEIRPMRYMPSFLTNASSSIES